MVKNLTHKRLQDWVKEIREDNSKMVVVMYDSEGDKPTLLEHTVLDGQEYLKSDNKFEYIVENTVDMDVEKTDILLPITSEVVEKVSNMVDSKAISKIEKEIYDIVVEENESK